MAQIKVKLTNQEALDILTDALETNAIQYWACDYGKINIWRNKDLTIYKAQFDANDQARKRQSYTVTEKTIKDGVNKLLEIEVSPFIRKQVIENDNDADSCDCIIQAALFGAIIYG